MHSGLLQFSLCWLAISSSAKAITPVTGCGNPPPSEDEIARAQAIYEKERMMTLDARDTDITTVPTWFHVVYVNETEEGGYIPVRNCCLSTRRCGQDANALTNRELNSMPRLRCSAMLGHHTGSPSTWLTWLIRKMRLGRTQTSMAGLIWRELCVKVATALWISIPLYLQKDLDFWVYVTYQVENIWAACSLGRSSTICITWANKYQPYRSAHRLATTTTVPMISCRTAW